MRRIKTRLTLGIALAAVLFSSLVSANSALAQTGAHAKLGHHAITRATTDPPIPAQGKLGQDLFIAISHGDLAGVKAVLKRGADPNARNGLMFTPLFIAAASAQTQVMDALIQAGAKIEAESPYGTALSFACLTGAVPGIKYLIAHGANINPARVDGITPLMNVCRAGLPEIATDLINRKADVNAKDNDGATPLIFAAREGKVEIGRILLSAGAAVDAADSHGKTPLMYAAVNGHADFARLLLEKGANPNSRDSKGRSALFLAAAYGDYPEVVSTLLKAGADPKAADSAGKSASAIALSRGHAQCAGLLGESGEHASDLARAARSPKEAVQISLNSLQRSMLTFSQRTGCISCHQEGLGRMTTGAARDCGYRLDPVCERAETERIVGVTKVLCQLHQQALKSPEVMKQVPLVEIGEVATTYTWILAGLAAHKQPANDATAAMAMVLARQQSPDGHWGFMLPRVPMQSTPITFTALSVRSLKAYGPSSSAKEVAERIGQARSWLLAAPAQTSDDLAFKLLGLKWAGAGETDIQKAADALRAAQRADGGWSQIPSLQSDAYATGQALYALHVAGGLPVSDAAYDRGVQFLLRTQDDDGSWFVKKRAIPANNYFDAGFPHGESQYSSFNGTCWATLALLQTIDHTGRQASSAGR